MAAQNPSEAQVADALEALVAAFDVADIARGPTTVAGPDGVRVEALIDGRSVGLLVIVVAYCTGDRARGLLAGTLVPDGLVPLVIADRITADARELLDDARWGWLDRRGRLQLRGEGVRVAVDVPGATAATRTARSGPAIAGRGGLTVAYWLCDHPGEALSPTGHARPLHLAPSTISVAVRRLTDAGLVDAGAGVFPELFWELAAQWRPERLWLAQVPSPDRHRSPDPSGARWVRSGTAAAAAWDAPVATSEGGAVELYVPGPVDLTIAARRYGTADAQTGTASLSVAPVSAVTAGSPAPPPRSVDGWPVAPRLTVALDLAQDRGRGRQILEDWRVDDAPWH